MCGIAGFIGTAVEDRQQILRRMTETLVHRGPDDAGYWFDDRVGVALGHRRLSILDLSPAGHQPMLSPSDRYAIVFNGEIYNHHAIRAELERSGLAPAWRGHSDTETLLAAVDAWGLRRSLDRCVGMFALALWDRQQRRLNLARDRAGEKPLYYGVQNGVFLFGSELKALRAHPAFHGEIDREALALYLRHNYVPDPYSIYRGIHKLSPGAMVEVDEHRIPTAPVRYWDATEVAAQGQATPFEGSDSDALTRLESVLGQAVADQMIADVPLGAFLSGGIDSSLIVALMQARSTRPVKTFTIGFEDDAYNEAGHARAVAAHLGTDHTEMVVTPAEAIAIVPRLPGMYDEPFADSSQIPTALLCSLARRHVTVSLSGDAGDELFGGYTRYMLASRVWRAVSRVPAPIRRLAARALVSLSPEQWDAVARGIGPLLPGRMHVSHPGDKMHKGAALLHHEGLPDVYRSLISQWDRPDLVCIGTPEARSRLEDLMASGGALRPEEAMMLWDLSSYLPGDILVKVDRAAMAASLETRVPMLDHRVVELAWSLPFQMRVRDGEGKWLLRQLLYRRVPRALIDRPKMGFGVPIDSWLRGPLQEWAEALLSESRLKSEGFFDPAVIRNRWQEHLAGRRNWAYSIWTVLMFQSWYAEQPAAGRPAAARPAVHLR
jgi:asparagine synthase (glutamine-hydrolysing)